MKYTFNSIILILACVIYISCNNDDPVLENEEELITTVILYFTEQGGGSSATQIFRDTDGPGGDPPVISTQNLTANTTYDLEVELLNESGLQTVNVSDEVREEDEEHQLFFTVSGLDLIVNYDDMDGDGHPVGLLNTCSVGEAGSGTLAVILRHEPDKGASGVSSGDITNAGGETDVQVTFDLVIE